VPARRSGRPRPRLARLTAPLIPTTLHLQDHVSRTPHHRRLLRRTRQAALRRLAVILFGLACAAIPLHPLPAADPAASAPAPTVEETNATDALRSYLQLQEQLHATQLAVERSRKDAEQAAAETARVLGTRLAAIEEALERQRGRELEAIQDSNRLLLGIAVVFATAGFLAMSLMVFFQWRAVDRLAAFAAGLTPAGPGERRRPLAALEAGETQVVSVGAAGQSNARLLGALERLEQRIHELEHATRAPLNAPAPGGDGSNGSASARREANGASPAPKLAELLEQGQACLDADKPEAALTCLEELLSLEPGHAEAWVKKGAALERLGRLDDALQCYDRAIARDASLTIAYLHKGGLYNRLERFDDALACYEQALHTQEKRTA